MKRIAVTGSIATDHLATFPARFTDQLVADKLTRVSLSFLVDELSIRRGGVGANIAFGLASLGMAPLLVGAVGRDFDDYAAWLRRRGVDIGFVRVSRERYTARFLCTTDVDQNQIASFYAGAMREARDIDLRPVLTGPDRADLVVIAPNDPDAMLRHTAECRDHRAPFAADPSQQLARLPTDAIESLVTGARYLFTNDYERTLLLEKTGWTDRDVLARVDTWITTLGDRGARVDRAGADPILVPAAPPLDTVDPTGAGDAFRAGFLYGVAWNLGLERATQLGCLVATAALETLGTQEYTLDRTAIAKRAASTYGSTAAGDIEAVLRT
ncbi:carbohydrate kinase family protein [Actinokineospora fastidiosa]|uniref:Kinase n=1 Tax=Actinokineospora fastidiosa TaxID=1816 RepID=A0A918GSE7_9PSEU|nr:carbohydrate kinase family protein [Actinokineospora fastidiosa]GGS58067.1 kinase [Actinokineospora fastidiosa]